MVAAAAFGLSLSHRLDFITSSLFSNDWFYFAWNSQIINPNVPAHRGRRQTFTLEYRPGQTRLILSGLLGNRQGAWSNLWNSASSIYLFLFLCLSRLLTFSLGAAAFPICRYLSHPLKALISLSPSPPPPLCQSVCMCICVSLSDLRQCVLSGCAAVPPPHLSHQSVCNSLRQTRPSVGYQAHARTHTR